MTRGAPRLLACALTLALAAACGHRAQVPEEPVEPVTVAIQNLSGGSVYIPETILSFTLHDAAGRQWMLDRHDLCTQCDSLCESFNSRVTGDPIPIWIELLPGYTTEHPWSGKVQRDAGGTCACGVSCLVEPNYAPGDYTLRYRYERLLPAEHRPYREDNRSKGMVSWSGTALGRAFGNQTRIFSVTLKEGPNRIDLAFK